MKNAITILIVDDEEMMRGLIEKILQREGYRTLTAVDGVDALEVMQKSTVDIVLSDVRMPRMDGNELLTTLKRDYPDVGVAIMTSFGDMYTVKDALVLGADEYLTKPFRAAEIIKMIERTYWRLQSNRSTKVEL